MKYYRFLLIGILFIGLSTLNSCKKDDEKEDPVIKVDPRDQYVGTWQYKERGNLTFYYNGEVLEVMPVNESDEIEIKKSGTDVLLIDDETYYVNGDRLTSDPENVSGVIEEGVNIVGTVVNTGKLSTSIITINSSITGSWNNSHGATGNLSGKTTITLTR